MKSEEGKKMDDFLRDRLLNYETTPPPRIWKNIIQKLPYKPFGKYFPSSEGGLIATIGGFIVVTSAVVYLLTGTGDSKAVIDQNNQIAKPEPTSISPASGTALTQAQTMPALEAMKSDDPNTIVIQNDQASTTANLITSQSKMNLPEAREAVAGRKNQALSDITETPVDGKIQAADNPNYTAQAADGFNHSTSPAVEVKKVLAPAAAENINLTYPVLLGMLNNPFLQKKDFSELILNQRPYSSDLKDFTLGKRKRSGYYKPSGEFLLSAYFQPEWLLNEVNGWKPGARQSAGVSMSWIKHNLSLTTGVEVGWEQKVKNRELEIRRFLGSYLNLDSITFQQLGNEVIPYYYYHTDSIFDSAVTQRFIQAKGDYYYLKIPLLLGWEKQVRRFTFSLQTGPVINLLLSRKQYDFTKADDLDHLISSTDREAYYYRNHVQWTAKCVVRYAFTDQFGLYLAPNLTSYLNNIVADRRQLNTKPVYWGVQSGFYWKF